MYSVGITKAQLSDVDQIWWRPPRRFVSNESIDMIIKVRSSSNDESAPKLMEGYAPHNRISFCFYSGILVFHLRKSNKRLKTRWRKPSFRCALKYCGAWPTTTLKVWPFVHPKINLQVFLILSSLHIFLFSFNFFFVILSLIMFSMCFQTPVYVVKKNIQ